MIGCQCRVCRSTDPRDRRGRPSILIDLKPDQSRESGEKRSAGAGDTRYVLVDTSSDLRAQALTYGVRRVDAILFTHSHADHVFGLDDVRRYNSMQKTAIPCYADALTATDLRRTFSYIFGAIPPAGGGVPKIVLSEIGGVFTMGGADVVPVPLMHGPRQILGFRLGSFAYLTDCSQIPEASWPLLEGVDTLVLDALRDRPHPTHFTVEEALAASARIGATRTFFTHISHDLSHADTCARLPTGVELAYDGQILEIRDSPQGA